MTAPASPNGPVIVPPIYVPAPRLDAGVAAQNLGYALRRSRTAALAYDDPLLNEFRGAAARKTLDRMALHPIIMGIVERVSLMMRSVSWTVRPGHDPEVGEPTDLDREFADFTADNLSRMETSWQAVLGGSADMLIWGFALHEAVYFRTDKGEYRWAGFFPRDQRTVYDWRVDEHKGTVNYVVQMTDDGSLAVLPGWKLLHFRTAPMAGRPEGKPLVRNAFLPWADEQELRRIIKIGIRRDLTGLPVAYVPAALLSAQATDDEQSLLTTIRTLVQQVDRDELEGLVFPGEKDENGRETGFKFQLMQSPGRRQLNLEDIWGMLHRQIAVAVMGEVVLLGLEARGTQALADVKTNTLARAIAAWLDDIGEYMRTHACKVLQRLNPQYAGAALPAWEHGDLEEMGLEELAAYVAPLIGAGAMVPDPTLEAELRRKAGLPMAEAEAPMPAEAGVLGDESGQPAAASEI